MRSPFCQTYAVAPLRNGTVRATAAARLTTTLSSKVNLHHAINFRALCGANLVTYPADFRGTKLAWPIVRPCMHPRVTGVLPKLCRRPATQRDCQGHQQLDKQAFALDLVLLVRVQHVGWCVSLVCPVAETKGPCSV